MITVMRKIGPATIISLLAVSQLLAAGAAAEEPMMRGTAGSVGGRWGSRSAPAQNRPEQSGNRVEPKTIQGGASQSIQVIDTDIGAFIINANPPCSESARVDNGYYKVLAGRKDCGKQVRLHSWTCRSSGQEGWRPEVVELPPCE